MYLRFYVSMRVILRAGIMDICGHDCMCIRKYVHEYMNVITKMTMYFLFMYIYVCMCVFYTYNGKQLHYICNTICFYIE